MTEFHINVVRLNDVTKHPNADSLYVAKIHGGYPVIFKGKEYGGSFSEGDLAVYIPVDSLVPATKDYAWLSPNVEHVGPDGQKFMVEPEFPREKDRRIRAKKLRGVFSMGMLVPVPEGALEGQDVAELMGIKKYEEPECFGSDDGLQVPAPLLLVVPSKYDIEGMRRYTSAFRDEEDYVCTEKLHGENARFVHDGKKLHLGSRTRWLTTSANHTWSNAAKRYDLETKLAKFPNMVFFGETYGNNSDMPYGVNRSQTGSELRFFDIWDANKGVFLDYEDFVKTCQALDLMMVPELCRGKWEDGTFQKLMPLAEGKTTLQGNHVREGFVIKPLKERYDETIGGRLILKMHGEGFLTRKEK